MRICVAHETVFVVSATMLRVRACESEPAAEPRNHAAVCG